jgi:hypothetical protein
MTSIAPAPNDEISQLFSYVAHELYPQHTVYVPVDYVTRSYRDLGLVYKLHEQILADLGPDAKFLVSIAETDCRRTNAFLRRSGYVQATGTARYNLYVKTLR